MLSNFEWCKMAYEKGWGTKEQLKVWVKAGKITAEEYEIITGDTYTP